MGNRDEHLGGNNFLALPSPAYLTIAQTTIYKI